MHTVLPVCPPDPLASHLPRMFISFEGIDGSGKSTQLLRLSERLLEKGREVVTVREPGGTPLGESIRDLLLDPGAGICPRSELLLFCAARSQLIHEVIRPALERGAIVLADRFIDSTTAYQLGARSLDFPGGPEALHRFTTGGLLPTRTFWFDLSPQIARTRRGPSEDRIERESDDFFDRVAETYRLIADNSGSRVIQIDAAQSDLVIEQQVNDELILLGLG